MKCRRLATLRLIKKNKIGEKSSTYERKWEVRRPKHFLLEKSISFELPGQNIE